MKESLGKSACRKLMVGCCLTAAAVTGYSQTRPLNDTGIDFCGEAASGNNKPCLGTEPSGQDFHYGRDAQAAAGTLTKIGGGGKGFDFTALNASGQPTTPSSGIIPHACVRDNVTGLIWEVKTDDGGFRDKDWTYTWYDSVNNYDGTAGSVGTNSTCNNTLSGQTCNTQNYVAAVQAMALCGYSDWRMPTLFELHNLVDRGRTNPSIDPTYFPNTSASYYWSASPVADNGTAALLVNFMYGHDDRDARTRDRAVRLVRGGL